MIGGVECCFMKFHFAPPKDLSDLGDLTDLLKITNSLQSPMDTFCHSKINNSPLP